MDDLIAAVESEQLSMSQMREAARFILDRTSSISENEVDGFLAELNEKWPVFKNTQTVEAGKVVEEKEKEVIDKLSAYIQSLDDSKVN
ncbi:MAG: hypothetical protein UZ22_OP11002000398 [Microgenomates bacterium OLB23]|nr:MAG: hypothetical protein UZ22_OP11002000398 [Microgenomates bacterium OLB23]